VPAILLRTRDSFILHQTLDVAAKLGVADRLEEGWRSAVELALELKVNEYALYRALRLLASQGSSKRTMHAASGTRRSPTSCARTCPAPFALFIYWGSDFTYPCFGQTMHSMETGEPSRTSLSGTDGFVL
jgi:hypothetical protein